MIASVPPAAGRAHAGSRLTAHEQHFGGERAVEEAAGDRVHGHPRAGQLHPVGDQAVHGDRHGEREQRESGHPVRDRHRPRRAACQRQLAVHPQREQHLEHGQAQRDGRQQRVRAGTGSAPNMLNE